MIYLDHASTTYIYPEVQKEVINYLEEYGNPSNLYDLGQAQKSNIEWARERIAKVVGCNTNEIFFTSGSSEGNAWALNQGRKCLCSPYEHHNIINNDKTTVVDEDYLKRCLSMNYNMVSYFKNTFKEYVYSHMLVNNETGEVFSITENLEYAKQLNMFTHSDMTQALGNLKINLHEYKNLDMATFSGHKIHAPKGVGFCYIKESIQSHIQPLLYGGNQERGLRAGTENVPYIMGLAKAVEMADAEKLDKWENSSAIRKLIISRLDDANVDYIINEGSMNIPSIVNIAFKNIEGEALMLALNDDDIYIGTGSACNTGDMEPSHVLSEMGVPNEYINGAVRLSFDKNITLSEVSIAMHHLIEIYHNFTKV